MAGTTHAGRRAVTIGEAVWAARRETSDGRVGWIALDNDDGTAVTTATDGLYRGQLGVGVFFAALAATEDGGFRRRALVATEQLLDCDRPGDGSLGIGNGLGGLVYGLSVIGDLLDDDRYLSRAAELITGCSSDRIAADDRYDVLHGAAGGLLGALKLARVTDDPAAVEFATQCGRHLLNSRYDKWGYGVWDTGPDPSYTTTSVGMGHGVGGIALALARLGSRTDGLGSKRLTNDSGIGSSTDASGTGSSTDASGIGSSTDASAFTAAAADAIRFENTFYSASDARWKANWRSVPDYPPWWCYGTPGIGAARLATPGLDRSLIERDVRRAIRFQPEATRRDSLCHGLCSRIDFRLGVARSDRFETSTAPDSLVDRLVATRRRNGHFRLPHGDVDGLCNPSLFVGRSGIGYTLLRHRHPERLPSLLRFN